MGGQHLKRVLVLISFGIHVGNLAIQNTKSALWDQRPQIRRSPQSSLGIEGEGEEAGGGGVTTGHPGYG